MNTPMLTFFNNKGGVGKTSLLYHLAWMFASMGKRVVCFDIDPQSNLTAAFLEEDQISEIWQNNENDGKTIYQCVRPLSEVGKILEPVLQTISTNLYLLAGDVGLSQYEDALAENWPKALSPSAAYRPMLILSSFWQVMQMAIAKVQADVVLVDIGPNLGAINRSVLIATDYVAIPLGADLFSLQGLKNLGPTLRTWKKHWERMLENWQESTDRTRHANLMLPSGKMQPIGYLCQQHSVRLDRPVQAFKKWVERIPNTYRTSVICEPPVLGLRQEDDPHCLATIKHYRSLIPMAQEKKKPIFNLTSADGAFGSHSEAVQAARSDFEALAIKIAHSIGMDISIHTM